jgi:hypothetical protein
VVIELLYPEKPLRIRAPLHPLKGILHVALFGAGGIAIRQGWQVRRSGPLTTLGREYINISDSFLKDYGQGGSM